MIRRLLFFVFCTMLLASYGCGLFTDSTSPKSQAAKKAFETRTIDAKYDDVYAAAVEAMFDLGYTIIHSEKSTGIIVGEKNRKRSMMSLGMTDEERRRAENEFDTLQLTIYVKESGKKQTAVRIKTSFNKIESFHKKAIDQVWIYIQRQVMMEETHVSDSYYENENCEKCV